MLGLQLEQPDLRDSKLVVILAFIIIIFIALILNCNEFLIGTVFLINQSPATQPPKNSQSTITHPPHTAIYEGLTKLRLGQLCVICFFFFFKVFFILHKVIHDKIKLQSNFQFDFRVKKEILFD